MGSKYWHKRLKYREEKDTVLFFRLLTLWWERQTNINPSSEYSGEEINRSMLRLYIVTLFI